MLLVRLLPLPLFLTYPKKSFFSPPWGLIGQLVYVVIQLIISNDVVPYIVATIAIALYAEIMARFTKSPTTIYLAVALIPLVPGGGIYYTMLYFINEVIDPGNKQAFKPCLFPGPLRWELFWFLPR